MHLSSGDGAAVNLTILRIVATLLGVMICLFVLWEAAEQVLVTTSPGGGLAVFYLLRGVSTALVMSGLTAWLIYRYRRRYEEALRLKEEEARRMKDFFQNIVRDAGEAIICLDNEGVVQSWNRSAEGIYGYSADEIIGQKFHRLVPQDLLVAGEPQKILDEIRQSGYLRNYETRRLRKDGATILVRITTSTLRDAEGRQIGSSAIVSDITAEKEMEARLLEAERSSAIGQLAASTAHEVRNALAGIWGTIEVIQRSPAWRELPPDIGVEVREQIARIGRFVDDVLAYGRPETIVRQRTDIHALLERVLSATQSSPEAAGKQMVRRFAEGKLWAEIDMRQIEQALSNVIKNGYQAMEAGGTLAVTTAQSGACLEIRIADSGAGMTSQTRDHAFDPFFTTKPKGAGLGLSITRTVFEAHKGSVVLAATPQGGTTVTLRLPSAEGGDIGTRPKGLPAAAASL